MSLPSPSKILDLLVANVRGPEYAKRKRARRKDRGIHAAISAFIKANAGVSPVREEAFRPEVLIPCFNHGRFVEAALRSVATSGADVTVIDDASTDGTREILRELGRRQRFRLLENAVNLNQAGSLNAAIASSRNDLFVVLNADDVLLPWAIPTVVETLAVHRDVFMVGGGAIPFTDEATLRLLETFPERLPYSPRVSRFGPAEARGYRRPNDLNMTMSGCAFLRSAWKAAGGFRPFEARVCSADDRDFQMRVSALCTVAVVEEPLALYRTSSSLGLGRS
jgi:GT2 family glycosyltransferase